MGPHACRASSKIALAKVNLTKLAKLNLTKVNTKIHLTISDSSTILTTR